MCRHVRLTENLGGNQALCGIAEDTGDRVGIEWATAAGSGHDLKADLLEAVEDTLACLLLALTLDGRDVERLRAHRRPADHQGGARCDTGNVAADAVRVLAVDHALRGHGTESPDNVVEHLVLEREQALFLLDHPVVTTDALVSTLLDRQAGRLSAGEVDVSGNSVTGLVHRHRAALHRDVLRATRGTGVKRRDGLDEVVPTETDAARVMGNRQRHRDRLFDHRGRVAAHDPGDLVTPHGRVELRIVGDFPYVEVEDVESILLARRPEPHVTAHSTRANEGGVETIDGHVGRADEVDLIVAWPCGGPAKTCVAVLGRLTPDAPGDERGEVDGRHENDQRHHEAVCVDDIRDCCGHCDRQQHEPNRRDARGQFADFAGNDERRIEQRVELARECPLHPWRVVDPVHDDEQLIQRHPAAHSAHAAREHEVDDACHPELESRDSHGLRCPRLEQAIAPRARLDDEVARGVARAERSEEEQLLSVARHQGLEGLSAGTERLPAHPDGVNLVDEDDALSAPFAG